MTRTLCSLCRKGSQRCPRRGRKNEDVEAQRVGGIGMEGGKRKKDTVSHKKGNYAPYMLQRPAGKGRGSKVSMQPARLVEEKGEGKKEPFARKRVAKTNSCL